ncbi:E3 ubiquitin/ISG15 ligase TRIM25-like isoform X2 [Carassius gibelio]|uniref:E3 ubiquitin/ISG15 ligase TRIM25-like isoform X2 n=1 Tax=Carassius gibelio TaxID=101364 RepID=UPI0022781582|nr:E3 ubiquitin/ISG15 ligase TRIM25-like isoform X2 [Carassius gibelio]
MAEASISWTEDQFRCSVCLDLLKDPVTIPCGHTYCMCCISECWDQEDWKGFYSCPQCRQIFSPRPVLYKNVVFAEMVEKLKKTRLLAAFPVVHHAGSGDVQCDSCTGIKQKAVKSCLECLISYCQTHLEQHESLFRDQKHNLMDATGRLQELICSQHNKLLEIYCRTDQQCICMLCFVDEHKNHDTVSTAAERKEKQRDFEETQNKFQKLIHQREKDLQELRVAVDSHKSSAQTAVEDSERVFTELIRSIEKRLSEVKQLIRDQERAAVSRAEEQLERLKKEIDDLKRKDTELQQLSETQDHVHFLQSWPSVCLTGSTDSFTVSARDIPFDDVVKSVSQLRDKLQQFCTDEIENISKTVKSVQIILTPECETREEFLPSMSSDGEPIFNIAWEPLPGELSESRRCMLQEPTPTPKIAAFTSTFEVGGSETPREFVCVSEPNPSAPFSVFGGVGWSQPPRPSMVMRWSEPTPPAPVGVFGGVGGGQPPRPIKNIFGRRR